LKEQKLREKREYQRAPLDVTVKITSPEGREWETVSIDISVGGMFLGGLAPLETGSSVTLQFALARLGQVSLPAFIRWSAPSGFGVQFGLLGARETHAIGGLVRQAAELTPLSARVK
jgi:type IV pilus assembly protein PilZ